MLLYFPPSTVLINSKFLILNSHRMRIGYCSDLGLLPGEASQIGDDVVGPLSIKVLDGFHFAGTFQHGLLEVVVGLRQNVFRRERLHLDVEHLGDGLFSFAVAAMTTRAFLSI